MIKSRESWAKVGGITALACLFAGLYFGVLNATHPHGGFVRDLLSVGGFFSLGIIFATAIAKTARRRYFTILTIAVMVTVFGASIVKLWLKDTLRAAFSDVLLCQNRLAPGYREPKGNTDWSDYWRNY